MELSVSTLLHFTQQAQAEALAQTYLETFKTLQKRINLELELSLYLRVGDVLFIAMRDNLVVMRVYELSHEFQSQTTFVVGRTMEFVNFFPPLWGEQGETDIIEAFPFEFSIEASGQPQPIITSNVIAGTLPTGLTLQGASISGTATGIPLSGSSLTVRFVAQNLAGRITRDVVFTVLDERRNNRWGFGFWDALQWSG